jgi:hypothetical protein
MRGNRLVHAAGTGTEKQRNPYLGRAVAASIVASVALAACTMKAPETSASSTKAAPQSESTTSSTVSHSASTTRASHPAGLAGCAPYYNFSKYHNHEYEVCTAYVGNTAEIALQGFYKFGNNRIGFLADGARHHFETRYWNGPRQAIEHEVDSWPTTPHFTGNFVDQSITLVSLSSDLKADRGLLQTRESWKVTDMDGAVRLNESNHLTNVTMCRGKLPGHPLHEWVVVSFMRSADYDCIGFDQQHHLAP